MPHSLSERQKEVLDFVRNYVRKNESSPRLEEIAARFDIKAPTAHKLLEALQQKGYLYFGRDKVSGFFIRLIERAGSTEVMVEVAITGRVDAYGEVKDFPQELGQFASVLVGSQSDQVFALVVVEDIPQASILAGDLVIFDVGKKPQPGDICIAPMGERLFLVRVYSKTYDQETWGLEVAQQYPIPQAQIDPELKQDLNWAPIAYDGETEAYYVQVAEEQHWPYQPIKPEFVLATAPRLTRPLAF
jgi:repressor LexA